MQKIVLPRIKSSLKTKTNDTEIIVEDFVKFTDLPITNQVSDSDILPIVQTVDPEVGPVSMQVKYGMLRDWLVDPQVFLDIAEAKEGVIEAKEEVLVASAIATEAGDQAVVAKLAAVAAALDAAIAKNDAFAYTNGLHVSAHRGFESLTAEGTNFAYRLAYMLGANSFECDVQVDADGKEWLIHDTVTASNPDGLGRLMVEADGITPAAGAVKDKNSAYIATLKFKSLIGTSQENIRIQSLDEYLDLCNELNMYSFTEIKAIRSSDKTQSDIAMIYNAIKAKGLLQKTTIQVGSMSNFAVVRALDPELKIGLIGSDIIKEKYEALGSEMLSLGNNNIFIWYWDSLLKNPEIVTYCKENKIDVIAWTIGRASDVSKLMRIGVNKLMCTKPMIVGE